MTLRAGPRPTPVELSRDAAFERRVKRLVAISAVALGAIWALALGTDTSTVALFLLFAGWLIMPSLLAVSLRAPFARYLLAVPASLVLAGLVMVATQLSGPARAVAGWWSVAAGVAFGGTLGGWLWYRWLPVPAALDYAFSRARWTLIGVHAGLVAIGLLLVLVERII